MQEASRDYMRTRTHQKIWFVLRGLRAAGAAAARRCQWFGRPHALEIVPKRSKGFKSLQKGLKGMVRLKKESKEPIRLVQESSFQKPIRLVLKPIRID